MLVNGCCWMLVARMQENTFHWNVILKTDCMCVSVCACMCVCGSSQVKVALSYLAYFALEPGKLSVSAQAFLVSFVLTNLICLLLLFYF